ncbi:MAG TPA: hypothetical protein VH601_13335 [Bryobacteraceae bacterium]|jgi:hypothetical protein
MSWTRAAEGLSYILSVCLILRLLILRLHSVYRVFCLFLLSEVLSSSIAFYELFAHNARLDYRLTWMAMRLVAWVLMLWMVYAFISAVLQSVPGILKFSRKLLNYIFPIAIVLAALSFKPEYTASGISAMPDPIDHAVGVAIVLERVIATVAVLVFAAVMAFVLWFPVQMPRNLAVFSVGLVVYFGAEVALLLLRSYFRHDSFDLVSAGVSFVLSACYIYWGFLIRPDGERVTVRMGHSWQKDEQERLLGKLDALNAALMHAGRREISSHTRT